MGKEHRRWSAMPVAEQRGGTPVETDEVTIRISRNGPCHETGKVKLVDHEGTPIENDDTRAGEFWLCRCGGSKNKPFCDSTHSEIGFKGAIAAVAAADAAAGSEQ